jgi:hypothetical protein
MNRAGVISEMNAIKSPHQTPPTSAVQEQEELTSEALIALHTGRTLALRIPGFYPPFLCSEIAERMVRSELYGSYANAPRIGRVGQALFETLASNEHRQAYEANALVWIQQMRRYCAPYLSPIDKLRLRLDETWPSGTRLGSLNGRKMFVGLARVFDNGAAAEPHQDVLHWDIPNELVAQSLTSQFAANIYLSLPEDGGDLLVWPQSFDQVEYDQHRNPGSYGVRKTSLQSAPVRISPRTGELILFSSLCVHAVEESHGGKRVTWSCFIGAENIKSPLMVWS